MYVIEIAFPAGTKARHGKQGVNSHCGGARFARYCGWLENEGYIAQHGKDGTTTLYRATDKADKSPETPYPPITDRNPFERENAAAARLATLMLCHDPYQPRVAAEIIKQCNVLLARFGVKQLENGGQV
jgi:hypothetical protein